MAHELRAETFRSVLELAATHGPLRFHDLVMHAISGSPGDTGSAADRVLDIVFVVDKLVDRGVLISPKVGLYAVAPQTAWSVTDATQAASRPAVFTWVPFFEELATKLVPWRARQSELVGILEGLRNQDLVVTPLADRDADGRRFLLKELDPYTFMGVLNRGIAEDQRFALATALKVELGIEAPVPADFEGVPRLNNMASWFIRNSTKRLQGDTDKLWDVFVRSLAPDAWADPQFELSLDRAFAIHKVATKLAMGLFWARPRAFVALDQHVRRSLQVKIPADGINGARYRSILQRATQHGVPPYVLSLQTWLEAKHAALFGGSGRAATVVAEADEGVSPQVAYWLVGAYWDGQETPSQVERFLTDGVWENGYEDRLLEKVRSMAPGDRIAIKSTFTRRSGLPFDYGNKTVSVMRIFATGTIASNPGDGRTVHVDWDPDVPVRDWYFYTHRTTIWKLKTEQDYRHREYVRRLIEFVWNDSPQDYAWFLERWAESAGGDLETGLSSGNDEPGVAELKPYGIENMRAEGLFLDDPKLEHLIDLLRVKKAVILQGPPGVGKTFVARRLAYALMETPDDDRIVMIQFHQSYAYEDFIRGYRPGADGRGFVLQDGVFLDFCRRASSDLDRSYVFVIDEINRGNLSQIFGELLMLIEADKRHKRYALPLTYRRQDEGQFFVPPNVHVLGLMNTADRSLAMVDYALRRRFAFVDLEPQFESPHFRTWMASRSMPRNLIDLVVSRMSHLNEVISKDPLLGPSYVVGHSFFCPRGDDFAELERSWYERVVKTEVAPLLREYWFDDRAKATTAVEALLMP